MKLELLSKGGPTLGASSATYALTSYVDPSVGANQRFTKHDDDEPRIRELLR